MSSVTLFSQACKGVEGCGISLMQENIGFAVAAETPLVIIDVQRIGPSTGVPSLRLAGIEGHSAY